MEGKEKGNKGKMRIPLILFVALLSASVAFLTPLAFAEDEPEELQAGEFLPSWDWVWLPICMLAVLVSALLNGTLYIIGKAINSQNLERYALSEMLNTAATAIMAIILIAALTQALDFVGGLGTITCGGEEIKAPIDADMCRTNEFLQKVGEKYDYVRSMDRYSGGGRWPEIEYSFMVTLLGIPVYAGVWNQDLHKEVETYHSIAYICVNLMIALSAKMFMLQYVKENMLAVFLPLGIILRTFHFTRGIGAFFMSVAIGFFFVYPTICFIMDSSFAAAQADSALPEIITTGMCNMPIFGSFSFGAAAMQSGNRAGAAAALSLANDLGSFVADTQASLLYNNFVALAISITFIRFATTILGGDITPFLGMVGKLV